MTATDRPDVAVLGAGVIGLCTAWRLAQRGLAVTLVDPEPGSGASHAAAGMLAPVTELHFTERPLLDLTMSAASGYPAFVDELEDVTGRSVGYRRCGTVTAAWDAADLAALRDLHAFQHTLGLDARLLSGRELRGLEPGLAPGLPGGVLAPEDHQVDPAALVAALLLANDRAGTVLCRQRVREVVGGGNRIDGVRLEDGSVIAAATTVVACGAWSQLAGLPPGSLPPVRPVKGQTLLLRGPAQTLAHVVRGSVRGVPVYLVPRTDGRVVIGASSEEAGFDVRPRAGAVHDLLRDAQALVPAVTEMELVDVRTGLRPATPDNAPVVGPGGPAGLLLATGHYRNGVLLAASTAAAIAALLIDGAVPPVWAPFTLERFAVTDQVEQPAWT